MKLGAGGEYDGLCLCNDCAEKLYFTCEVCGKTSHELSIQTQEGFKYSGKRMCPNCFEKYYDTCASCGKKLGDDALLRKKGEYAGLYVCADCSKKINEQRAQEELEKLGDIGSDVETALAELSAAFKGGICELCGSECKTLMTCDWDESKYVGKKMCYNCAAKYLMRCASCGKTTVRPSFMTTGKFAGLNVCSACKAKEESAGGNAQAEFAAEIEEKIYQSMKEALKNRSLLLQLGSKDKEVVASALRKIIVNALGEDADLSKKAVLENIESFADNFNKNFKNGMDITADDIIRAK